MNVHTSSSMNSVSLRLPVACVLHPHFHNDHLYETVSNPRHERTPETSAQRRGAIDAGSKSTGWRVPISQREALTSAILPGGKRSDVRMF